MRLTLLEIVQDVLNDLDSDSVNNIMDTQESEQITAMCKSTYYEMLARRDYPHLYRLVDLDPSNDATRPTHMRMQTPIQSMGVVSYNKQKTYHNLPTVDVVDKIRYEEIAFLRPEEFLHKSNQRDSLQENVEVIKDWSGIDILIKNDKFPQYYTSFDDEWLIFDSYNLEYDTTLQASKVQAFAVVEPQWVVSDTFVPDLPSNHFPAYVAEVKSVAFLMLKQMPSQKSEQQSSRSQRWLARKGRRKESGINYPNYGRRGKLAASPNNNPQFGKD